MGPPSTTPVQNAGHGNTDHQPQPEVIEALRGKRAVQVAAGRSHSLELTEEGGVFTFGCGEHGRLGNNDEESRHQPMLIEALRGKQVLQVAAGGFHSLALTEGGEVFSWGSGSSGKLGHGTEEKQLYPKLIEGWQGMRVVQLAAEGFHSLALTADGAVFSFGWGHHGQTGHGTTGDQLTPKLIEALGGKRVVQVAAGYYHSMALTQKGKVFSWGDADHGRLGHGTNERQVAPKLIEALRGRRVVQVAAGGGHSMALTQTGKVFSWGSGDGNRLGHGSEKDKLAPMVVAALQLTRAVQLLAGGARSFVRTELGDTITFGAAWEPRDEDDEQW